MTFDQFAKKVLPNYTPGDDTVLIRAMKETWNAAVAACAKQCMGRHSLDVEAQECAKAVRKLKEKI